MNGQGAGPGHLFDRLWSWVLGAFFLVLILHVTWLLLEPLLPVLLILGSLGVGIRLWLMLSRSRW